LAKRIILYEGIYLSVSDTFPSLLGKRLIYRNTSGIRCRHVRSALVVRSAYAEDIRRALVKRSAFAFQNRVIFTDVFRRTRITTYELRMCNVCRAYCQRTLAYSQRIIHTLANTL